jgi:hypothetical protein
MQVILPVGRDAAAGVLSAKLASPSYSLHGRDSLAGVA